MDEDSSLATIAIVVMAICSIGCCLGVYMKCRRRSINENEFIEIDF